MVQRVPIRVLVVNQETAVRRFLRINLCSRGCDVREAGDGEEAMEAIATNRPDVALLDLAQNGIQLTRQLRRWCSVPIVMLGSSPAEKDFVNALDAGVDHFLSKPYGMEELTARMRAVLRRVRVTSDEPSVTTGYLHIDLANRRVSRHRRPLVLTPTEYDILRVLALRLDKVATHRKLLNEVWGFPSADMHTLRVNVSNLRRKVEENPARPKLILTESGVGYRLRSLSAEVA